MVLALGRAAQSLLAIIYLQFLVESNADVSPRPHIILILADDMGWNDVGFHGADDIATPNIDALAYHGVILNHHYTLPLCTPSRAALLTGKYPIRTGMHHLVILENEPWGLGLDQKILPQYLKEVGYNTHAIGKWHLGFYKKEFTPTFRGFDTHFGYWQGYHDYYNHTVKPENIDMDGFDMRRNMEPAWDSLGEYSTDLFTNEAVRLIKEHKIEDGPMFLYLSHLAPHTGTPRDPLQAPYETIAKFSHIQDLERRIYAAMVSKLDDSVGEVVSALQASSMLDNSVIIFLSDNGGPTFGDHSNKASNYPLRGMKAYPWEGGTRAVAAIWSPLLRNPQRISNQIIHQVDWLPTLASLAGVKDNTLKGLDGLNAWLHISEGQPSPRSEFVYNIDEIDYPYAAIRKDKWKYVNGTPHNEYNGWMGDTGRDSSLSYSTENVIKSRVAATLSGYYVHKAILDNIKLGKNKKDYLTKANIRVPSLTEEKILSLRRQSEVHCLTPNNRPWTKWENCNPLEKPCLFDLDWDPCESSNIASEYPDIAKDMEFTLHQYNKLKVPARNKPGEESANPALWNNVYTSWHDDENNPSWIDRVTTRSLVILTGCLAAFTTIALCVLTALRKPRVVKQMSFVGTLDQESPSSSLTGDVCVRND